MAKKKVNRKKVLKKQFAALRKAGKDLAGAATQTAQLAATTVSETAETLVDNVTEATSKTVETVTEKVQEATAAVADKVEDIKEKKAAKAFDAFVAELDGVATARLETFYAEGISSIKDFAKWSETELLALKGIGPATIKQLKELGVTFKK